MAIAFRRFKRVDDDAIVDRLTGVYNRRRLDSDLAEGIGPEGFPTATLMIDLDDFASHVGAHESVSADQILERVAWIVMATVRMSDIVYRNRPSSFCVLLPATVDEEATVVAERIRANIESAPLLGEAAVTVSVGVAVGASTAVSETLGRADAALAISDGPRINRVVRGNAEH